MFKNEKLIILKNITSLGSGDASGTIAAQIPLKREVQMKIPIVDGTSLKGTMKKHNLIKNNVSITDMKIILFPIPTEEGAHYITCPFILKRLAKEIKRSHLNIGTNFDDNWYRINFYNDEAVTFNEREDYKLIIDGTFLKNKKPKYKEEIKEFMKSLDLQRVSFSILSDDVFCFLVNKHTSISIRNRINQENTTVFDEEQFPSSTIFYFWCLGENEFNINKKIFQLGGNRTLGRGKMKIRNIY